MTQTFTIRITSTQAALIARVLADNPSTVAAYANCGSNATEREQIELLPEMFAELPNDEIIDRPAVHDFAEEI